MELILPNNQSFDFEEGFLGGFSGLQLKGANIVFAKTRNTEAVIQNFTGQGYSLQLCTGKSAKKIIANDTLNIDDIQATFVLTNSIRKKVGVRNSLHIRQGYYSLSFNKSNDCSAAFDSSGEFKIFSISYTKTLLTEISPYFTQLLKINESDTIYIGHPTRWITPGIKEILTQISDCSFTESASQLYYNLKVRELLLLVLQNSLNTKTTEHQFTPFEKARIIQAKEVLESFVDKKAISLKELSRKVSLNEFKLKIGFQQQFNSSIYKWLVEQKMQLAKKLVLSTNKPVKELAKLTGYSKTNNFIAAFKRKFGVSPGTLRK